MSKSPEALKGSAENIALARYHELDEALAGLAQSRGEVIEEAVTYGEFNPTTDQTAPLDRDWAHQAARNAAVPADQLVAGRPIPRDVTEQVMN